MKYNIENKHLLIGEKIQFIRDKNSNELVYIDLFFIFGIAKTYY